MATDNKKEGELLSQEHLKIETVENVNIKESNTSLTAAQKARAERNRQRALEKREARLVQRTNGGPAAGGPAAGGPRALDSGGGFLREEEPPAPRAAPPPAPVVLRELQPRCLLCGERFPQSYLFDTFDYSVCDNCRDEDGDAHELVTRTDAKSEYLLQDCDLDLRPPALRCERRRNPHGARAHDMRLYLRAQLRQRALLVWGSERALEDERAARAERRARAQSTAARRRLRALRLDARSSLFGRERAPHAHAFGPETYDAAADAFSRACACGHVETYEKM